MDEIVPDALLLIDRNQIKMDESSLTGESKPITKETYEKWIKKNISPIILSVLIA